MSEQMLKPCYMFCHFRQTRSTWGLESQGGHRKQRHFDLVTSKGWRRSTNYQILCRASRSQQTHLEQCDLYHWPWTEGHWSNWRSILPLPSCGWEWSRQGRIHWNRQTCHSKESIRLVLMTLLFSFMMYCYTLKKCSLISLLFHKTTIQHNIQHSSNSSKTFKTKESLSANIVKIVHYFGFEMHFLFRSILPMDTSNYYIYMYFLPTEWILSR